MIKASIYKIQKGARPVSMKNFDPSLVYNVREVSDIRELITGTAEKYPDNTAFIYKQGNDTVEIKYSEVISDIAAFGEYLNSLGLEGKKIAVIGKNCYEWALTYLTVTSCCGIIVPVDRELKSEEIDVVLSDCQADAIVYCKDSADKIEKLTYKPTLVPLTELGEYLALGRSLIASEKNSLREHKINDKDVGIIIYTSGTTGLAKGVALSQYNVVSDLIHVLRYCSIYPTDRTLSVLPLHHTYEALAGFLSMMYIGGSIAYNRSIRTLLTDFKEFQPSVFVTVPLILEKFHKNIMQKYASMKGGKAILAMQKRTAALAPALAPKIFASVHEVFGGRLRMILSGAAPIPENAARDFEAMGFAVYNGYGLTETSPICIMHNDFYRCPDDIGYPAAGVECKIDSPNEDGVGELAVRGSNVMLGYYNNPDATAAVMRDGWFYTGDLVKQKPNGAYQIVGRAKTVIVTKNGKKIFPEELEFYLSASPFVSECMVAGETGKDGDAIVTAYIFPDYDAVNAELKAAGKPSSHDEDGYKTALEELFAQIVHNVNEKLPYFRAIKKTVLRTKEFDKTTTKKIKRNSPENVAHHTESNGNED